MRTTILKPKRVIIDMDGTICEELSRFDRPLARPVPNAIEVINKLYDSGWFIIIYTARDWSEYKMTEYWLKSNGIRYHLLLCGKPIYDIWIDDRAIKFKGWEDIWTQLVD